VPYKNVNLLNYCQIVNQSSVGWIFKPSRIFNGGHTVDFTRQISSGWPSAKIHKLGSAAGNNRLGICFYVTLPNKFSISSFQTFPVEGQFSLRNVRLKVFAVFLG